MTTMDYKPCSASVADLSFVLASILGPRSGNSVGEQGANLGTHAHGAHMHST